MLRYDEMMRWAHEQQQYYDMEQAGRGLGYRGLFTPSVDGSRHLENDYWRRFLPEEPVRQVRGIRPLQEGAAQGPEVEGLPQLPKRPRLELNVRQHTAVALPAPAQGGRRPEAADGRGEGAGVGGFLEEEVPAQEHGQAAAQQEVADRGAPPLEATPGVEAPTEREVVEFDRSWQYLSLAMQRGANHVLRETGSQELSALQDCARHIEDLVGRAKEAAVEREVRFAALEKAEAQRLMKVAREQTAATQSELEKVKRDHEDQIRALKEAQEAALAQQKGEHEALIAEEQHKSVCKICLHSLRDSVLLPCMHFDYCLQCLTTHRLQQNTCPTCRDPIHGMLKCNLGIS